MSSNVLIETIFKKNLDKNYTLREAFNLLHSMNLINNGELAEKAISIKSKIAQCSKNTPGIDLVSGVQIKYAQTNYQTQSYTGTLKAHISIKNHTEKILAVVTETLTKKQYFFCFPYSAYMDMRANTFCIPFELDGRPRRHSRTHWWDYEVDSFEELCEMAK